MDIQRPDYQWLSTSNETTGYGTNGLNQITHVGGSSVSYDTRGNLTRRGGKIYSYNNNNLLTRVAQPDTTTNLYYDAENRLTSLSSTGQATTRFVYDGTDLIAETNTSGTVLRHYVHGPGVDDPIVWYEGAGPGNQNHLFANAQGSIISASDGFRLQPQYINAYDEYGVPAEGNQGRFQYTGQVWLPEVGLYYYKARMYDPCIGRFLQTDPIGYEDQMNLYAYVGNDPLNYTDPTGMVKVNLDVGVQFVAKKGGRIGGGVSIDFKTGEISVRGTAGVMS